MINIYPWHADVWRDLVSKGDRLPHALLLQGPQGIGKRALAEAFAGYLLCESPTRSGTACGRCDGCRWFGAGSHPDFRAVEPEALMPVAAAEDDERPRTSSRTAKPSTEIKIEQVRELADFLNVGSHRGRRRVVLVHPAEDMNANAANSLLKGLEEPAPGVVFLLVSHRPARLPATIRSRCVKVVVPEPAPEAAIAWLEGEGIRDAGRWLAYAGGAPLRALAYAQGASGEAVTGILRALAAGEYESLAGGIQDRGGMETLADALQKYALDRALEASGGVPLYGTPGGRRVGTAIAWLAFARRLAGDRGLARHPLNPKLYAISLLAGIPGAKR